MLLFSHLALGCRHHDRKRDILVLSIVSRQVTAIHSIIVCTRLLSLPALVVQALHAFRALLSARLAVLGCQILNQCIH